MERGSIKLVGKRAWAGIGPTHTRLSSGKLLAQSLEVLRQSLCALAGVIRRHRSTTGEADASETCLLPLSTGTNNVFPILAEPTIVGMVAGYQASGRLTEASLKKRVKVLHVTIDGSATRPKGDIGLIDATLLRRDHVGNLLPFDADRIERLLLTRAEPNAIGMSPIGGLIEVIDEHADMGLLVELGGEAEFLVPISPGLFQSVGVKSTSRIPFDVPVEFAGPGVLALDGDRDHKLEAGETVTVRIRRDGPWTIDIDQAMRWLVAQGIIAELPARQSSA